MKTILRILIILMVAGLVIGALVTFANTEAGAALLGTDQLQGEGAGPGNRTGKGNGQGQGLGNGQGAGNRNRGEDGNQEPSGISWTTWLKNLAVIGALVLFMVLLDTVRSMLNKRKRAKRRMQAA